MRAGTDGFRISLDEAFRSFPVAADLMVARGVGGFVPAWSDGGLFIASSQL
jgi:hypothetical protein